MTSVYNLPDYKAKFFEYKTLTKVHGKPTIDTILQVYKQLKRNAQCVPTTLGGGQLGYLALLLTNTAYATIPGATAFTKPVHPGVFTLVPNPAPPATRNNPNPTPPPLTPADISVQRTTYDDKLRLYNESQAVELALRNQLIDAFEPQYLQALRNKHTDMINETLPRIIKYLCDTYGKVSDAEMLNREQNLSSMVYDTTQPVDVIFNNIDEHADLADIQDMPMTDRRKMQVAYVILQRSQAFLDSLKKWNARATPTKSYDNMKDFFRAEYSSLEEVGALSIKESINHIDLQQSLDTMQKDLTQHLEQSLQQNLIHALHTYSSLEREYHEPSPPASSPATVEELNAATTLKNTDPNLLRLIESLTKEIKLLKAKSVFSPSTSSDDKDDLPTINPRTNQPYKRYCWTHGCGSHWGDRCRNPKPGHKPDATFKNRMGGSNKGCLPANN